MEGCWRAEEPQKTDSHFVLLFTISGFRTLSDLHGVTLSILMERLLCRWEPVYSPAQRSTGVYNQSLHYHAHIIRTIKNKSKTDWCKPFVNIMFAGPLKPLAESKKESFSRLAGHLNQPAMMTFWQTSQKQFTRRHNVFLLFFFNQREALHLHPLRYNTVPFQKAHLY